MMQCDLHVNRHICSTPLLKHICSTLPTKCQLGLRCFVRLQGQLAFISIGRTKNSQLPDHLKWHLASVQIELQSFLTLQPTDQFTYFFSEGLSQRIFNSFSLKLRLCSNHRLPAQMLRIHAVTSAAVVLAGFMLIALAPSSSARQFPRHEGVSP